MIFTSAAPTIQGGIRSRESASRVSVVAALEARECRDWSRLVMLCIRTVANAANATPVTAMPTAMVVSSVTRLASERR